MRSLLTIGLAVALVSPRAVQAAPEPAPAEPTPAPATAEPTAAPATGATAEPDPSPPENAPDPGAEMKAKAMDAYHQGEVSYKAGKFEDALASFQEASSFFASPDFQYNIGRCYENLEKYEDAVRSYEIYLRAKPNAGDSGDVRERIGRLRGLLEAQKSEGAEPDPTPEPVTPTDTGPTKPGRPFVISGAVMIALGAAAGIGGGVGFGIKARSESDELDEIQSGDSDPPGTFADAQAADDAGRLAEVRQIALAVTGAAVGIGGAVLLGFGILKNQKASETAARRPRITPMAGRHTRGLFITGRF